MLVMTTWGRFDIESYDSLILKHRRDRVPSPPKKKKKTTAAASGDYR
jgi:hypothetical protein